MKEENIKKAVLDLKPAYYIDKIGDFKYKIANLGAKSHYLVEKKDFLFRKSGKTHKIWQCTCPSYQKWAWRTHSCKHIALLQDIKEII